MKRQPSAELSHSGLPVSPRAGAERSSKTGKGKMSKRKTFPIVAIGSSGGLAPVEALIRSLSPRTGMAFVIIRHPAIENGTFLSDVLSQETVMPVNQVRDGTVLRPDHIYLIPSNTIMAVKNRILRLVPRKRDGGRYMPIDDFFSSLAGDLRNRAVGVLLPGGSSDGRKGLKAIREKGGAVFVIDEAASGVRGLREPLSAGEALSPEEVACRLSDFASSLEA